MTTTAVLPEDTLAWLAPPTVQQQAANVAQEAFSQLFRLSAGEAVQAGTALSQQMLGVENAVRAWLAQTEGTPKAADEASAAQALRTALMLTGLDQWGIAWSGAFGLEAIPALSALLGALRTGLDEQQDAQVQRYFEQLQSEEAAAIDFKITLRRNLHMALWHAMIACDSIEAAEPILKQLGSMWLALVEHSPLFGWRLVSDALANIQITCLAEGAAQEGVAQVSTQALFTALRVAVGEEMYQRIQAHAAQALIAWQQARRQAAH